MDVRRMREQEFPATKEWCLFTHTESTQLTSRGPAQPFLLSVRGGCLCLAPYVHNTIDHIDLLLEAMP
jgi:hypothetical protein